MQALAKVSQGVVDYTSLARGYAEKARSEGTLRVYGSAWRGFEQFAGDGALPATPGVVVAYLVALADRGAKVSTIGVKLAAVSFRHTSARLVDPTTDRDVRLVMAGIRRSLGVRPTKKAPVLLGELRAMVAVCDTSALQGKRDRALVLLGWAGAFRRSELVALDLGDLSFPSGGGVRVTLKRSKTDQEGAGMLKVIPSIEALELDPARALRAWLDAAGIKLGPVFRQVDRWGRVASGRLSGRAVAVIVKRLARLAGLDPSGFSGHSLRSGFTTAAASAGVESRDIMAQTGHKSEEVMRGYVQDAGLGASLAVRAAFGLTLDK